MVKAADIGKDARKFIKDDFFAGTEIKVNQTGCGKNTTTFKLGDSLKADHKVELASCPMGTPFAPATFKLNSGVDFEVEGKMNVAGAATTVAINTNLAKVADISALSISKTIEYNKTVSGIATTFDMKTGLKGLSSLAATNIGLAFAKDGFQLGVTGTIPNLAAPAFTNAKYSVGFAGCSHFTTSGTTTTGADWVFNGKFPVKGREIYWDFDYPSMAGTFACKVNNGKMKIDSTGTITHVAKYPVSENVAMRLGCAWNIHSQNFQGMGYGVDFSL